MSPKTVNSGCVAPVGLSSTLPVRWLDIPALGVTVFAIGQARPKHAVAAHTGLRWLLQAQRLLISTGISRAMGERKAGPRLPPVRLRVSVWPSSLR